jgi:arylsulfatase A-like enzyme
MYFAMESKQKFHEGSVPLYLFKRMGYTINAFCSSDIRYRNTERIVFGTDMQLCDYVIHADDLGAWDAARRDLSIVEQFLRKLDEPSGDRLFLIFLDSAHHDYEWPPGDPAPFTPYAQSWDYLNFNVNADELQLIMNRYRNALHFIDSLVGKVFTKLQTSGQYQDAVLVVTGDHGEEFLEHGKLLHASNTYRQQTHIPFFVRLPSRLAGPKSPEYHLPTASQVDLLPTLLDYLGIQSTNAFDGQSLLRKTCDQVVIAADNGNRDPVRFCIQSSKYKTFFRFRSDKGPIALQRKLYVEQITDVNDGPVDMSIRDPKIDNFIHTNCGSSFNALFLKPNL